MHGATQKELHAVLGPWQHGAIFLLSCALIVSRRPDAIFHAQFSNEDGRVFFADAYNFGWWPALFRTYEGYYHALPRLGAALALLAPLTLAPLVLNAIAICVQAVPVSQLISFRSSAWGSLRFRALLAAIYLALPNGIEIDATITNSQWILALIVFLVLAASQPSNSLERIFDVCVLLLCGLSGPFCIFLFPIALLLTWKHCDRQLMAASGILVVTCCVQAWGLINGGLASRPHVALGASPVMLIRILAGHVFLGTLLGSNSMAANSNSRVFVFLLCVAVGGLAMTAFCLAKSPLPLRLFVLLASVLLAVSLTFPTAYPASGVSMWELLARAGGIRYWYFPSIAFAWLLLCGIHHGGQTLKAVSILFIFVMCAGVAFRWEEPAFRDAHWAEYAKNFESAPPGTAVTIPESTPGWNLVLIKHAAR